MFPLSDLQLQIEISSNCNSRCLDCGRYIQGTDIVNPWLDVGASGNMSLDSINNIFDDKICQNIRAINFTGTYGEATIHPQFFEFLHNIAAKIETQKSQRIANNVDEKLIFMMETNGGLHSKDWWRELGSIIQEKYHKKSKVFFGIDGTDDKTHQIYRRGVSFEKVIENMKELRSLGVEVIWSMIVFEHNEHQLDEAKKMAEDIGARFKVRRSRLRHQNKHQIINKVQKKSNISKESISYSQKQKEITEMSGESTKTSIACEWRDKKQISIDYTTRVWQCCYFSSFYHPRGRVDQKEDPQKVMKKEGLEFYEKQYKDHWNMCSEHKLSEILDHQFFTSDLPKSFKDQEDSPAISRCKKHCGVKTIEKDRALQSAYK